MVAEAVRTCSVPECGLPIRVKGLCRAHYMRLWKNGDVNANEPITRYSVKQRPPKPVCYVEGCGKQSFAAGLCQVHYSRKRITGGFENCSRKAHHRMTGTREYTAWINMRQRCYYPKTRHFERYGGRGIVVCKEWRNSFSAFYSDMGLCPPGYELDRKENDGNYEPGNCRWISRLQNIRNSSATKLDEGKAREIFASKESCKSLAEKYGVTLSNIYSIRNGKIWSEAVA